MFVTTQTSDGKGGPPIPLTPVKIPATLFLLFLGLFGYSAASGATPAPLQVTSKNTVILDGSDFAGKLLQHHLIRGCVGTDAAVPYAPDAKVKRAESEHFPLLADKPGVEVPGDKIVLAVGATRFLSEEDKARIKANPGCILLRRRDNVVLISGNPFNGLSGTATAVTEFLNVAARLRFYAPSELWHHRPEGGTFEIGALDLFREQVFRTSFLAPYWKEHAEWLGMNQNGTRMTLQCFHNLASIYPPDKYGTSHPEIYEMRGGERRIPLSIGTRIWNPCLSAKALPEIAMDHIRERKKAQPALGYISLGMMDIPFECECPDCRKSVKETGSYSQLYFSFVNEVAKRSRKEYPELAITCFSYVNAKQPPKGIAFEPNVAVKVVLKSYLFQDPKYYEAQKAAILDFSNAGAGWFFHDWRFAGVTPRNDLPRVADFLRWAKRNRCLGAYYEYSPEQNFYLDGAYYWILMRLTSDPELDPKQLWTQYCSDMFGAGASKMLSFYQHFEERHAKAYLYLGQLSDMPRTEPALYSPQDVKWQRNTLEEAMALTKTDAKVQERLGQVMRHFRAHELFAKAVYEPYRLGREGDPDKINQALLRFYLEDDGTTMAEAVRYYEADRNIPPSKGELEMRLGYLPSVVANYSKGIATLLETIARQARESTPAGMKAPEKAAALRARALEIFNANVHEKALPQRVKFFQSLLNKTVHVPTIASMPKLDGDLTDSEWEQAAVAEGFSIRSSILPSTHPTRARVLRVGDNLVVGITCQQNGPVWAQTPAETLTGTHIWRESGVEVSFGSDEPGVPRAETCQYDLNAFGAYRGFFKAKDNREGVRCAVRLEEEKNRFTIEAVLPLKTAGYDYSALRELAFNVVRMIYTRNSYGADELLSWHPTGLGTLIFD